MNVVLFDEEHVWKNLLPLTYTRPVSELRLGIFTIKEKWDLVLGEKCSYRSQNYLSHKFPQEGNGNTLFVNSQFLPVQKIVPVLKNLLPNQGLYQGEKLIAFVGDLRKVSERNFLQELQCPYDLQEINNVWDIFQKNAKAIQSDFEEIVSKRKSQVLSETVTVIGDKNLIFLEEGAKAEACIFNTTAGPIYLGENSEVMEGSAIRGPLVLGKGSTLKLNTKIYGATTIGPHCKIGGEVSNSVVLGYSNKAHDGFLGNSVIGEWCNLGADTNNSNLKNNYGTVKLYNYGQKRMLDTGLQFCGLIMGDHSKTGINTMFNTGTLVGVGCNIFGGGFPDTHIPDFSWGGAKGFETYKPEKLFETATAVYERRGLTFSTLEKDILLEVFNQTHPRKY